MEPTNLVLDRRMQDVLPIGRGEKMMTKTTSGARGEQVYQPLKGLLSVNKNAAGGGSRLAVGRKG